MITLYAKQKKGIKYLKDNIKMCNQEYFASLQKENLNKRVEVTTRV